MNESTAKQVVSLFTAETIADIQIKNTSREGGDFREAIFARLASEKKLVVKLAENAFTDPEHIAMHIVSGAIRLAKRCLEGNCLTRPLRLDSHN